VGIGARCEPKWDNPNRALQFSQNFQAKNHQNADPKKTANSGIRQQQLPDMGDAEA
jgi:hypothetical protein